MKTNKPKIRNFVAKNMNKFNKAAVHKNKKLDFNRQKENKKAKHEEE
jgi:hypothetical protein